MSSFAGEDLRVQRTRHALFSAFTQLVLSRRYDEIRVSDIVSAAGVGRSTFYEHYRSKDDVLRSSMDWLFSVLADAGNGAHGEIRLQQVVDHFWENRRLAKALLDGPARRVVASGLADAVEARLCRMAERPAVPRRLLAVQVAEGQLGLLHCWLLGHASCTSIALALNLAATTEAMIAAAADRPGRRTGPQFKG